MCSSVLASPAPSDIDYWRRQFLFIGFCYSSVVASFAWFFWVPDNQVLQTYLLCVMALALIPMVLINSSYRPLMLVVMPPMVFALAARLLLYGDMTHSVFAVMLLMFSVLVVRIATQTNSSVVEAIRLKEDKDALIDELYRAKRDSDMARAKAEDANRAKSQFLANISPELRSPLNAILGSPDVLSTELLRQHAGDLDPVLDGTALVVDRVTRRPRGFRHFGQRRPVAGRSDQGRRRDNCGFRPGSGNVQTPPIDDLRQRVGVNDDAGHGPRHVAKVPRDIGRWIAVGIAQNAADHHDLAVLHEDHGVFDRPMGDRLGALDLNSEEVAGVGGGREG